MKHLKYQKHIEMTSFPWCTCTPYGNEYS